MKREYALPATFSATVLSFVFFGLPGTRSETVDVVAAPSPVALPKIPPGLIAVEEPPSPPGGGENDGPRDRDQKAGIPRLDPLPIVRPPLGPFVQPDLPPAEGVGPTNIIPPDWQDRGTEFRRGSSNDIDFRLLDQPPRARAQMAPEYPRELRLRHVEGKVVVEFVVDESGDVHNPVAVSATDAAFEEAALRAIARWKFEPGTYHNRKVRFRMSVPVVFNLNED